MRDSFISQEPRLLHDLILEAIRADDLESPYTAAALAMLSHSLPDNVTMPADAQSLFVQVFDFAAKEASVTTLKAVYKLLRGSSAHLLSLLSGKVLIKLEDHIFEILRNVKGDTSSLSLYCLAVLRVMLSAVNDQYHMPIGSYDTQELLASVHLSSTPRWKADAVRQFFNGEKAHKTLQLVVLRAMWACTSSTGEHLDDRLHSLQLVNEIIEAVTCEVKSTWRKGNALLVRKLEEKVTASGLDPTLRFRGLCFLLQVNKGGFCPALVLDGLRQTLVKPPTLRQAILDGEDMRVDLLAECGVFDHSTTTSFLQNLVDFATSAGGQDILEMSRPLQQILDRLIVTSSHDDNIVEGAMLALDVLSCGDKLQQLRSSIGNSISSSISGQASCEQAIAAGRKGMIHDLCKLFLTSAMCSQQSSFSISHETRSFLLDLYALSGQQSRTCSHVQARSFDSSLTTSVVQIPATLDIGQTHWLEDMANHFAARARSDHDTLSSIFHRAVADLEARC